MDIPINTLPLPKINTSIPKFTTIKDKMKKKTKRKYLDDILKNKTFLNNYFN